MYKTTDELAQAVLDRITDYECDPEPQYDDFCETIAIHNRQHLKQALIASLTEYTKEISQG